MSESSLSPLRFKPKTPLPQLSRHHLLLRAHLDLTPAITLLTISGAKVDFDVFAPLLTMMKIEDETLKNAFHACFLAGLFFARSPLHR